MGERVISSHINLVLLAFIKTKMNSSLKQVMLWGEKPVA